MKIFSLIAAFFLLSLLIEGEGRAQESRSSEFESAIISSQQLPAEFDEDLTFEYLSYSVNADSLLTELSEAGVRVTRGWLPLDDRCMAIIGPRFTVELASNNPGILDFGFRQGSGRLRCASRLKLYSLSQ